MESRAAVARVFWRRNTGPEARYMPNTGVSLLRVLVSSRTGRISVCSQSCGWYRVMEHLQSYAFKGTCF